MQVFPGLQRLSQRLIISIVSPVLAVSIFSWNSQSEMETINAESHQVDPIKHADELYRSKEKNELESVKKLHAFLMQYKDGNNPDLLWRLARASRDLACLSVTDVNSKKSLTYEAHEYAKKALAYAEENFAAHKWYAITLSAVGDYETMKQKISNAYVIEKHFKRAIELNPLDATCYHLLGRWCFTVADVSWWQKKIASAIFETPPSSTFEEAIDYFERAERLSPNFYSTNQLMIAECYLKLGGKKEEARQWLEKLLGYDAKTEEDREAVNKAKEMLKAF